MKPVKEERWRKQQRVGLLVSYFGLLVVTKEFHLIVVDVGSAHAEVPTVEPLPAAQVLQLLRGHLAGDAAPSSSRFWGGDRPVSPTRLPD